MTKNKIGMKYEIYRAIVGREIRALKAVDEPILMRASKQHTVPTRSSEFSGIFNVGWMYAKVFENGSPLSRANDHASLETEAKMLNKEMNNIRAIKKTSRLVAGFDLVA